VRGCRADYGQFARTIGSWRRCHAGGHSRRALAAARRASPAPDVIFVRETPGWVPVTAAAVAVLLVVTTVAPYLSRTPVGQSLAGRVSPVPEARLIETRASADSPQATHASGRVAARGGQPVRSQRTSTSCSSP
jgi:hypothetical protein